MADRCDFLNMRSSGGRSMRDGEFDEEDVWAVVNERKDSSPKLRKSKDSSIASTLRRLPSGSRMIPRANNSSHEGKVVQQSAPVNIPDWSKIYRKNSKKGSDSHGLMDGSLVGDGDDTVNHDHGQDNGVDDDDDDDDDDDKVPPHEWIAKKLERTQIFSSSVCEGVGRTLKGRDLSKVRNAVLTRTGFLE